MRHSIRASRRRHYRNLVDLLQQLQASARTIIPGNRLCIRDVHDEASTSTILKIPIHRMR
jgi:hypothetical protein